jgi:hypothetical protein
MKRILFGCLLALLAVLACRKDYDLTTTREVGLIPTETVRANVWVRVLSDGQPVEGAWVEVGGVVAVTGADGTLLTPAYQMDRNGTKITVSKDGFFKAVRFVYPTENNVAITQIELISNTNYQTIDAATGGEVALGQDFKLTFPANSVQYLQSNVAYNGPVRVSAVHLDAADPATFRRMPGDLRAIDSTGRARVLRTFGMFGVELTTPDGTPLMLRPNVQVEFEIRVPASLQAQAPGDLPMWYFDEASGYWKQEDTAVLSNGRYVGHVSHFSFWNCDAPFDFVLLRGRAVDDNGSPLSHAQLTITSQNNGVASGWTDSDGNFGGIVPANENLTMTASSIYGSNLGCPVTIPAIDLGSFSADTDLGNIELDLQLPSSVEIKGRLLDCLGQPIANGFAIIRSSQQTFAFVSANGIGEFSYIIAKCTPNTEVTITATGYETGELQQTPEQTIASSSNVINFGDMALCQASDEFVHVEVDGITKYFNASVGLLRFDTLVLLYGVGIADSIGVRLAFEDNNPTDPQVTYFNGGFYGGGSIASCTYCTSSCECEPADVQPVTFTQYSTQQGEYWAGSTSGMVRRLDTGEKLPFSVTFKVKNE